jgi:hypothetical protein
MPGPEARGKTFKKGKAAPDALKAALAPPKPVDVKPTAVVAKEMFAAPKRKNAGVPKPVAAAAPPPPPRAPASLAPAKPSVKAAAVVAKAPIERVELDAPEAAAEADLEREEAARKPGAPSLAEELGREEAMPKAEAAPQEDGAELAELLETQDASPLLQAQFESLPADQREMAILIQKEEKRDLYDTQVPEAYVPETRRGFSEFIKLQYKPYILPSTPIEVPEGEKYYPYQKFVRDYMRKEAPYRGILVYHGLGSGKTCTAIAAAEALFATSPDKKIIVMSPASLKKNFLREVSKCGFRHFQLKNFWVALPKPSVDPTTTFFANRVLGLSARYLKGARNVWVPDFRKPQSESNYETLPPEDRAEIRKQILSVLEYHPVTNPTGRIRFIAYNGFSAKKLINIACNPEERDFFDNAVIVVDEIHNLIRTIQGTIEPYLVTTKDGMGKKKRKLEVETITPERWTPNPIMCSTGRTTELYKRGYMFYRLLLDARNSKIVGLSGTPLINFPEELGILSNILHGYITIIEGVIAETGRQVQVQAKDIGFAHSLVDYIGTKNETGGTRVIMSLLPPGNRKISNEAGVMRVPPFTETETYTDMYSAISDLFKDGKSPAIEEVVGAVRGEYETTEFPPFEKIQRAIMTVYGKGAPDRKAIMSAISRVYAEAYDITSIVKSIQDAFKSAGLPFREPPTARSEALLPPFGDEFKNTFVPNGTNIINKATLLTRLTGLVSYYKGSSLELMPRVKSDEVVRVPFSEYAQKAYSFKRSVELKKEMEAVPGQTIDMVWAQIYELGDSKVSNNYKMGSRQACNFAFPPEVARPSASKKEMDEEAAAGQAAVELVALAPDAERDDVPVVEDEFPELEDDEEEEDVAKVAEEDRRAFVPVTIGDETDAIIAEYYAARGEEVPEEERGIGARDNAIRAAEMERMAAAPRVPQPFDEPIFPREPVAAAAAPKSVTMTIRFGEGLENKWKPLDIASAHPITVSGIRTNNKLYPSVAAFIEVMKPDPDYEERKDRLMKRALEKKFESKELTDLLLSTRKRPLIYVSADPYWGEGADKRGQNKVGKMMEALREDLLEVSEMPALVAPKEGGAGADDAKTAAECKAGKKPGEDYSAACARAKVCLGTIAKARMLLGGENGLAIYSAKFAAMLERMVAAPGSSLVYSQFLDMEGVGIFRVAMDVNGYAPIDIVMTGGQLSFTKATEESLRRGPGAQPRYITFSGVEKPEVRAAALSIFNAQFAELPASMNAILKEVGYTDNKVGELCRVICITSAGAEGLSLRNVRAVHIMEPYWNEVRLKQVKGRAIRIGSHLDLPQDQRDVSIYTYLSVFSDDAQSNKVPSARIDNTILTHDAVDAKKATEAGIPVKPGQTSYVLTTDEMIYSISERKRKVVEALECVMKSSSIDCEINMKKNKDGTFTCLPLKGKVGDFIYNPVLRDDILAAPQFVGPDGKDILDTVCVTGAAPVELAEDPSAKDIFKALKGVTYRMRPIFTADGATIERFDMYQADQAKPARKIPLKLLGTAGAKDGKPAPPVKLTGAS